MRDGDESRWWGWHVEDGKAVMNDRSLAAQRVQMIVIDLWYDDWFGMGLRDRTQAGSSIFETIERERPGFLDLLLASVKEAENASGDPEPVAPEQRPG